MAKNPIEKAYESEIDQFLHATDQKNPTLSLSQQKEKEKYARIYYLRDVADRPEATQSLWDEF